VKLGDVLDVLKTIVDKWPAFAFIATVSTGTLLLAPQVSLERIGVAGFRDRYSEQLGLALVVSSALLVMAIGQRSWTWLCARRASCRVRRSLPRTLAETSPQERAVLAYCLLMDRPYLTLPLGTGVAWLMQVKGLLLEHPGTCPALDVPYYIPTWVWRHIKRNPSRFVKVVNTRDLASIADRIDGTFVYERELEERVRLAVATWNAAHGEPQPPSEGGHP